jgi:hypothetical protein
MRCRSLREGVGPVSFDRPDGLVAWLGCGAGVGAVVQRRVVGNQATHRWMPERGQGSAASASRKAPLEGAGLGSGGLRSRRVSHPDVRNYPISDIDRIFEKREDKYRLKLQERPWPSLSSPCGRMGDSDLAFIVIIQSYNVVLYGALQCFKESKRR